MLKKFYPKSVFITGASSGIGRALALEYADKGIVLHLCGRNADRLKKVDLLCQEKGADVLTYLFDTTDEKAAENALQKAHQKAPLDLVVANAGVSGGVLGSRETPASTRQIIGTNVFGTLNTVLPAIEIMKKRGGQIALVASLAGYRGMGSCPAYSASKALVKAFGEALRGQKKYKHLYFTTICPGFIETPLTDKNKFYMPFLMKAEKAAQIIHKRLERAPALIAFPGIMAFGAWLGGALPTWLALPLFALFPKKEK
ncbi:MAG: SDR family NAD(P)-dependent oxidoreductase [Alphaproteobacteria bacterium]